jgi:hypothetical protein
MLELFAIRSERKFHFRIFLKIFLFLRKYENFYKNLFLKIDAKSGNIDLEYFGNVASD